MISVEEKDDFIFIKVTGDVTANDIMIQVVQYMEAEQIANCLWDFTQTTKVTITTVEMKGIADTLKKFSTNGKARKVALVSSKTINIGLGKLFVAFAQIAGLPYTYKVFRDIDHAKQWLKHW
jgi:hypothetical protein